MGQLEAIINIFNESEESKKNNMLLPLLLKEKNEMKYKGITIHKNKNCETWYTRLRKNGKQVYISARTQKECYTLLKKKYAEDIEQEDTKQNYTFIQWYQKWLELFKIDKIKPQTIKDYEKSLNKLPNEFINKNIENISALEINNIINKCNGERAKQKVYEFLRPIFIKAKDYKITKENIFSVIEKPKHEKEKGIALTDKEQNEFIKQCKLNKYGKLFIFMLYQGLRLGEALALTYNDIDFSKQKITINKQYTHESGLIYYTKNQQSTRIIPLFKKTKSILKNINSNERIFIVSHKTLQNNLNKIINKSNIRKITSHDLRHTFITNCQKQNIPEFVIQAIVGHEIGSKVTKQVYTHFNFEDNIEYLKKLN